MQQFKYFQISRRTKCLCRKVKRFVINFDFRPTRMYKFHKIDDLHIHGLRMVTIHSHAYNRIVIHRTSQKIQSRRNCGSLTDAIVKVRDKRRFIIHAIPTFESDARHHNTVTVSILSSIRVFPRATCLNNCHEI